MKLTKEEKKLLKELEMLLLGCKLDREWSAGPIYAWLRKQLAR